MNIDKIKEAIASLPATEEEILSVFKEAGIKSYPRTSCHCLMADWLTSKVGFRCSVGVRDSGLGAIYSVRERDDFASGAIDLSLVLSALLQKFDRGLLDVCFYR